MNGTRTEKEVEIYVPLNMKKLFVECLFSTCMSLVSL
jgi:hypothetical protein